MVLGLAGLGKGLMGLLQGGGFGIGYGFGVRLGYDTYGGIKDLITGKAQQARYSKDNFTSHLGSGILSALGLKSPEASQQKKVPDNWHAVSGPNPDRNYGYDVAPEGLEDIYSRYYNQ